MDGVGLPIDGPIEFYIDGRQYVLDIPPWRWMQAFKAETLDPIFPYGLRDEDLMAIFDRLDDDDDVFDIGQMEVLANQLIEAATGLRWWTASRLLHLAALRWTDLDSYCVHRGVDLRDCPPSRICAAAYAMAQASCQDAKDVRKLDNALTTPPPGQSKYRAREAAAKEAASFAQLSNSLGGGRRARQVEPPAEAPQASDAPKTLPGGVVGAAEKVEHSPRTLPPGL